MPFQDSANPLGAGNEQASIGGPILIYAVTPTTIPVVGDLVQAKAYTPPTTPGDTNSPPVATVPKPPFVAKLSKTGSFAGIGVCVGGASLGSTPVAGGVAMIKIGGPATVIFAASTTYGHVCIVSTATAGVGKDSATATLGKTYGTILQTKTISSGTAKVPVWVNVF